MVPWALPALAGAGPLVRDRRWSSRALTSHLVDGHGHGRVAAGLGPAAGDGSQVSPLLIW